MLMPFMRRNEQRAYQVSDAVALSMEICSARPGPSADFRRSHTLWLCRQWAIASGFRIWWGREGRARPGQI